MHLLAPADMAPIGLLLRRQIRPVRLHLSAYAMSLVLRVRNRMRRRSDLCVSVHASIFQSEDVRAVSFIRVVTTS